MRIAAAAVGTTQVRVRAVGGKVEPIIMLIEGASGMDELMRHVGTG